MRDDAVLIGNREDDAGRLHMTPELRTQILRDYLGPALRDAVLLKETPLSRALERNTPTVFEADSTFTFACHLKTALLARTAPDENGEERRPAWKMIPYRRAISILWAENTGEDAEQITGDQLTSKFDPLVIDMRNQDFRRPPTDALYACMRTRWEHYGLPTVLLVRRITDLPTVPDRFSPELLEWISTGDMSRIRKTNAGILSNARNQKRAKQQLLDLKERTRFVRTQEPANA